MAMLAMAEIYIFIADVMVPSISEFFVARWHDIVYYWDTAYISVYKVFAGDVEEQETWYQYLRDNILVQVAACLLIVYCAYRLIYIPLFQDFIVAERCRFRLENQEPLKVGESVIYTISGFLPPLSSGGQPDAFTQKFFNALTAKVTLHEERIPAMKAYADDDYGRIKMIFTVEKSGTYKMDLRYNGFVIPGSPYELTVPPDFMSPTQSVLKLPSIPVLLTDGMPQTIEIYPRDRTGYPCSIEGVRLDKFDFHASTEKPCCDPALCGKVCEIVGGLWKEGLDASFTYEGSPFASDADRSNILILLTIRTNFTPNSCGIFEGQVCYDGEIMTDGCFPIVSLTCEEYERIEPIVKNPKADDVVHLKGEIFEPEQFVFQAPAPVTTEAIITEPLDTTAGPSFQKSTPKTFIEWYMLPKGISEMAGYTPVTKEVYVDVTLESICIKEVEWTVILSRTAEFSIKDETKIVAVPETEEKLRYLVTITDANMNEIRLLMSASNTRMLMALYLKFRAAYVESLSICDKIFI